MATRSFIGILNENETVTGVYCHFDGYPDGVGKKLVEHYSDRAKAAELIALGGLSILGPRVVPEPDEAHSFDQPVKDVTVAYHRDRLESKDRNYAFRNLEQVSLDGLSYGYVLIPEGWLYRVPGGSWRPLVEG
jgi:hypothetical protein